jgi:DNA-binding NarL/FixJ family response regulator
MEETGNPMVMPTPRRRPVLDSGFVQTMMGAPWPNEEEEPERENLIEVLIVSKQRLVAEALAYALESLAPGLKAIGVAGTWDRAMALCHGQTPMAVLVDSQLIQEIPHDSAHAIGSRAVIVIMGDDEPDDLLITAVEAEWRGYVDKELPLNELISVIRRTVAGEVVMPTHLLYRAIQSRSPKRRNGNGAKVSQLTPRERQVLALISSGLDNKSIAAALGIRVATARSHVQRILEKLGVHSKLQAVQYANRVSWGRPARRQAPRRNAVA